MKLKKILIILYLTTTTFQKGCPNPLKIQSSQVKQNFSLTSFLGTYYEIAYHDYTQPIKICGCMRSIKTFDEKTSLIKDDFTLNCGSTTNNKKTHTYHNDLSFKISENPGVFLGKWPLLPFVDFPDTLVDFGPVNENGQYSWVLEFQCVEELGRDLFVGVNFYSAERDFRFLEVMKERAKEFGIFEFVEKGLGLTLVEHEGCQYDNSQLIGNVL